LPYNPQIQDVSGQLRAQGIAAAGQNYGAALTDAAKSFQAFQQNKLLANQAVGQIEGTLKANPELFGILSGTNTSPGGPQPPSQAAQAFMKLQKNGSLPMQEAAMLSQYVQTYGNMKAEAQKQSLQMAQAQQMQAQTAGMNRELDQSKADDAAFQKSLMKNGGGALNPEAFLSDYARFGGSPNGLQRLVPVLDTVIKSRTAPARPEIKPVSIYGKDAKGGKTIQSVDALTGEPLGEAAPDAPAKYVLTPEETAKAEQLKVLGVKDAENAQALLNTVSEAASKAKTNISRMNRIQELYDQGETTGWGQEAVNTLTGIAARAGIVPRETQAKKEELQMLLAKDAMEKSSEYFKGQGAVSDSERARIDKIAQNIGKTPEANLAAMKMARALNERAVKDEILRRQLLDAGKSPLEAAEAIRRARIDSPLPDFDETSVRTNQSGVKLPPGVRLVK